MGDDDNNRDAEWSVFHISVTTRVSTTSLHTASRFANFIICQDLSTRPKKKPFSQTTKTFVSKAIHAYKIQSSGWGTSEIVPQVSSF